MENNLEEKLKKIKRALPKRKDPNIDPYILSQEVSMYDTYSNKFHSPERFSCIVVRYREEALENPLYILPSEKAPKFTSLFEEFYDLKTGTKNDDNEVKRNYYAYEWIKIPRSNPRVIVRLNTRGKHMSFAYKEGDKEAEKIIKGFIELLKEN